MGQEDRDTAFLALSSELRAALDPIGVIDQPSPGWTRALGWSEAELQGRLLVDLVHLDDRAAAEHMLEELGRGASVRDVELRLRHLDGGNRWVRCQAAPNPDGQEHYLVAVDITEHDRERAARELLEQQARIGTWEVDVGTGRATWSTMTHELHGTDPAAGETPVAAGLRRYPPESYATIEAAFTRLTETGEPYDLEVAFLGAGGDRRRVRTAGRALLRDGVVVRVYGTFEDVTEKVERQREQAELARTRELLEEAQRLARLGHWESDLDTGEVTWSPVVYEIVGVDPDSFVPTHDRFMALVHPDDRAEVSTAGRRTRAEGAHVLDYRVCRPDGQIRSVHQVGRLADVPSSAVPDAAVPDTAAHATAAVPDTAAHASATPGAPRARVIGTIQDVTELRRAEQALRDSQELLERVLAATNDGWWDIDLVTGESFYSDRWWALCGYEPGELPMDPEPWRQLTHPDDMERFVAEYEAVLTSGVRTFVLPSAGLHRDGHRVPMVVRGLVDYDEHGKPVRLSGATADITEIEQAEAAKEEFISTVSHELRTPLTSIGGAIETLVRGVAGDLPNEAVQLVDIAQRNTRRLQRLIDDLLDLERFLTERHPFDLVTLPLNVLLDHAVTDHEPYATLHNVRFVLHPLPVEVLVRVDLVRLEQVLANYLSNAAKFAPRGSNIEVVARRNPNAPGRVRVEVIDRGPGVPVELEDRIFERFVQADPADPRSRGGTGLGLAISQEIIERHGGHVGLDQRSGRTCFWFELPVAPAGG